MRFLADEQSNLNGSLAEMRADLAFHDELDALFSSFLYRRDPLRFGETKYFAFGEVVRGQILRALANVTRPHLSEAFAASRVALEAAFYAKMISMGQISEDEYFEDPKKKAQLARNVRNLRREGKVDETVGVILDTKSLHSENGSHADASIFRHRVEQFPGGSLKVSFFQSPPSSEVRYHFLGMLWVEGLCLKALVEIARDEFRDDVASWISRLDGFKERLQSYRLANGIGPAPVNGSF